MTATLESPETIWRKYFNAPRIPQATYRLQFNSQFTFDDARHVLDYLESLGISDLYASPIFKPRSGSSHGYDTVDYNALNPVLGEEQDFYALSKSLQERSMGFFLDIVPNHMGVSTENDWWTDVLKHGPSSAYAPYFDIDWKPQNRTLDNKVLLPILHTHYGQVLEEGLLNLVYWHGDFYVHYYEHQFPMTPESYIHILEHVLDALPDELEADESWVPTELASLIYSLKFLPYYWLSDQHSIDTRRREQTIIRWRLLGLFDKSESFRLTLENTLQTLNGTTGDPSSFDILDQILSQQPYYLAYWQVASDEINYRRFFDVNDMAAICTEDLQVFQDVHRLTFKLLAEGCVTGLRIDHPDGLWDPQRYFRRLQGGYIEAVIQQQYTDLPDEARAIALRLQDRLDRSSGLWPLYVLVEKILSEAEPLPSAWSMFGTTGYDFMYAVNNLFVDSRNEEEIDKVYQSFTSEARPFYTLTDETKQLVMAQSLTSEIGALSAKLARIVEKNRRYRGFTRNSLAFGLKEFISALDIYRTYITGPHQVSDRDHTYIESAMARAKKNNPLIPGSLFDFLYDILLMRNFNEFDETQRIELRDFVMKFQQITGPVMAKSMEDTAFYIYNRLVSLNEVGGHPAHFGIDVPTFHAHNIKKLERYPYSMLATSTHDTKRSEDVRCRINVLSEMPDEWSKALDDWSALNETAKIIVNNERAPSHNDEYLIYQTLLGTYDPQNDDEGTYIPRIIAYMHKAINEAKTNSNWINPNRDYAQAVSNFITAIWQSTEFRAAFAPLYQTVSHFGRLNSLSQTLLKLTCPGVPDLYQGTELWNYSLVDPDNRRPVDFERRSAMLEEMSADFTPQERKLLATKLLGQAKTGAIKLYVTHRILDCRRQHPELFRDGSYTPVEAEGPQARHVCAFMRQYKKQSCLVVAPRFAYTLARGERIVPVGASYWQETRIRWPEPVSPTALLNIFTGESIEVGEVMDLGSVLSIWPIGVWLMTS